MRVISCLVEDHNVSLVLLAAAVCIIGCLVTMKLLNRAIATEGLQRGGWIAQTAAAAGASVWCTHFVGILAYEPKTPVDFDPILTIASLGIAFVGFGIGFAIAANSRRNWITLVGGIMVGATISAMHYVGMAAYHISGIVEWNVAYIAASVVLSVALGTAALYLGLCCDNKYMRATAPVALVLAIVSLHFTGMAAVTVTPLFSEVTSDVIFQSLAVAIAGVSLFIVATGIACHMIDSRSRNDSMLRLHQMAMSDALTGLPNRACFAERIEDDIVKAKRDGRRVAVVGIDLNRFKEINDLRGHRAGDRTLQIIATRLTCCLRSNEFIARVGGDEFSAIKIFDAQNDLIDFANRLESAFSDPLEIDDFVTQTSAAIGLAVYPTDGAKSETLIGNADLAMYRAKADPIKNICFYESGLDKLARDRQLLARDLRRAVELKQLELHFQVQISVATSAPCGFEALLRWQHPERGMVPPLDFIPLAEENGSIIEIGEWVLREACYRAASWKEPHKIAVNLSAVQLKQHDLPRLVHEILIESGLSPSRLELEITETAIIEDKARALHVLRQIKALGVTVALDDFGTGYSSLDTLRSFPFDKIKLDRLFMNEVESNPQSKAIVRAVMTLGQSLNVPILAEGVETADQLELLRREGCDEAQGYLLGKPKPEKDLTLEYAAMPLPIVRSGYPEEPARLDLAVGQ
jgi:diguanylate cyclase (GGDEF)-like protein